MGLTCCKKNSPETTSDFDLSYRGRLLHEHKVNRDVYKHYDLKKIIGGGSMSTVWLGHRGKKRRGSKTKPSTQRLYALKAIRLDQVDDILLQALRNEIDILRHLDHPNIIRMYETFGTTRQICIAMEYCSGGNLYCRRPYSEQDAAKIISRVLSAVFYMHENNVVHRDIKFENIMFENTTADAEVKIIDFGLSRKYFSVNQNWMTQKVGTFYTMAPEVFQGVYTSQCDLWSVGVVTYMLLSGQEPFKGKTSHQIRKSVLKCNYSFSGDSWSRISPTAKGFVADLLKICPRERLTADQALKSTWMTEKSPICYKKPDDKTIGDVQVSLRKYVETADFKKLALMIVAHKSTMEEIGGLRDVFYQYDLNKDGTISLEEFRQALATSRFGEGEIGLMFKSLDLNETGQIFFTEFLAATVETRGTIGDERILEAFDRLDGDGTGFISRKNVSEFLGSKAVDDVVDQIMDTVDMDNDGKISRGDFLDMIHEESKNNESNAIMWHHAIVAHETDDSNFSKGCGGGK